MGVAFWYGLSLASSHALFITGRDSCLGSAGAGASLLGKSEGSIFSVLLDDVEGRACSDELDIFLEPPALEGRDWERKSGFGLSKKKDLIRLLLLF